MVLYRTREGARKWKGPARRLSQSCDSNLLARSKRTRLLGVDNVTLVQEGMVPQLSLQISQLYSLDLYFVVEP